MFIINIKQMQQMKICVIVALALLSLVSAAHKKSCVNKEGKEVDWFVIFLYPQTSNKEKELAYGYYDNNSKDLEYDIFNKKTFPPLLLTHELDKLTEKDAVNYFFWNDDLSTEDTRQSAASSKAHSKGGL